MNTITANEARELVKPSPLETAYNEIRVAAKNGKSSVILYDYFWSIKDGKETIEWLDACLYLKENGFTVKLIKSNQMAFHSGEGDKATMVSW